MAKIVGAEGLTTEQMLAEVQRGGKFVYYPYVISLVVITFSRNSDVHLVRAGENRVVKGLPYALMTLVLGWWGFPWGLIRTPIALVQNFGGGVDVTPNVMSSLGRSPVATGPQPVNGGWGGGGGSSW